MNADSPTPRVGYSQLKDFIGKRVLFVGKVDTIEGGIVQLLAPDGSRVKVHANTPFDTAFVEVLGTVMDPESIREELHVHFGDSFDLNLYGELLKLSNGQHVDLFYARNFS